MVMFRNIRTKIYGKPLNNKKKVLIGQLLDNSHPLNPKINLNVTEIIELLH